MKCKLLAVVLALAASSCYAQDAPALRFKPNPQALDGIVNTTPNMPELALPQDFVLQLQLPLVLDPSIQRKLDLQDMFSQFLVDRYDARRSTNVV